ncbi:hypothetical protein G6F42_021953 [Rhizopus arrhizus]|nr:hypothetical protein G6F42_021953 [Rhizopus arrhizus]
MERAQDPENAVIHKQFEEACSDFQVPATRAAAEQVLTQFRQVPKVLPACQYILEHASNAMVQFQISLAIGDIAVRDYTLYDKSDLLRLKNFMIEFCLQREDLVKYVRDQLVLAVALITKRSLFDVGNEDREAILLGIKQLLAMDADNAVPSAWSSFGQCARRSVLQHQINHHWTHLGASSQLQTLLRNQPFVALV